MTPDRYRVESIDQLRDVDLPEIVEFATTDNNLQLPNPKFLALHATCCRVAHLSGASEYYEKVLRDIEDSSVLSEDGSSFDLLQSALNLSLGVDVSQYVR